MTHPHPLAALTSTLATALAHGVVRHAAWLLLMAAALGMGLANSPWAETWLNWLKTPLFTPLPWLELPLTPSKWVKDGLMVLFFVLVGLEIKRELTLGHLRQRQQAILPLFAAIGGMIIPASIYAAFNANNPATAHGWAIPCATDIAFAIGLLGFLGGRVPGVLKALLLAVAIFDDLGAILIIALFYAGGFSAWHLALALGGALLWRAGWQLQNSWWRTLWLLLTGTGIWLAMLPSGVHPSVAGVAMAMLVPLYDHNTQQKSRLLEPLEHHLQPFILGVVLPLFALTHAGISIAPLLNPHLLSNSVFWGVALGLLLGKPLGIVGTFWLAEKTRMAYRPNGLTWSSLWGLGFLAGVGFTMSLFVALLAFPSHPDLTNAAKAGLMFGSLLAASLGLWQLRRALSR